MSGSQEYALRWRGRQSGPYPISEINRMLDHHEIGMGHEILYQDQWITLEQFFAALQQTAAVATQRPKAAIPTMSLAPMGVPTSGEKSSSFLSRTSVAPNAGTASRLAQGRVSEGPPHSRLIFALLAVFAGYVGAHNFYARQWLTGLLQLLLSVATSLMGFGIIASWLWAMVEAVVVRKDGHGVEMF
jgi:TM2 domain-containing membrane protein YozV